MLASPRSPEHARSGGSRESAGLAAERRRALAEAVPYKRLLHSASRSLSKHSTDRCLSGGADTRVDWFSVAALDSMAATAKFG
jgi:hypothetical protein